MRGYKTSSNPASGLLIFFLVVPFNQTSLHFFPPIFWLLKTFVQLAFSCRYEADGQYCTRLSVEGHRFTERTCSQLVLWLHFKLITTKEQREDKTLNKSIG